MEAQDRSEQPAAALRRCHPEAWRRCRGPRAHTVWVCLLAGAVLAPTPVRSQTSGPEESPAYKLESINRQLAASEDPRAAGPLLAARASLLSELIATDPSKALALAFSKEAVSKWHKVAPGAALEARGEWEGTLEGIVADDFEHHRSQTRWYLRTSQQRFELYPTGPVAWRPGSAVRVGGIALAGRIAADHLAATDNPAAEAPQGCTTIGPQNIAVLMLTMPSNPSFPAAFTRESVGHAFFGTDSDAHSTDSVNGFWREMSWGQTSATGQVFGPLALSEDFTCDQAGQLAQAAIYATDATVDFTQFTRLALLFPLPSCASYSGMDTLGCWTIFSPSKPSLTVSVGWLPVFPSSTTPPVGLYAHELGHGLGLNHSSTDDYDTIPLGPIGTPGATVEYGDPFSLMGYPYNGSGLTSGQYPAQHKSLILNWLKPGGYQEVLSSGIFKLAPYESSGLRALRVLRDAGTGAWLWIEYRQPVGDVDAALEYLSGSNVFGGALIHYEDPALDPTHTYLLDFTPAAAPNNFADAALTVGHSWSDPYSPLTLTVSSADPSGLTVAVNYDQPCANLSLSSTTFEAAGASGVVTVSASAACAWTASSSADWITFTGPISGQGNGSVGFSVAANTGTQQRDGFVTVLRQRTRITQAGTTITVLAMSPSLGAGSSGQLTFQASDTAGYQAIDTLFITLAGGCGIQVNHLGSVVLGVQTMNINTPGLTVTNGVCTVSSSGSSWTGSGLLLTVTLQMSFSPAFSGTHTISVSALAADSTSSGTVQVGVWTAPAGDAPCTVALGGANQRFGVGGGTGSIGVTAPAGCPWTATGTVPWLRVTGGGSGSGNGTVNYSVGANPTADPRYGLLGIGGNGAPIAQAGPFLMASVFAQFAAPTAVAKDGSGNLYVADAGNHRVQKVAPDGSVSTVAGNGTPGYSGDGGPAASAMLWRPSGVALDGAGNLYIADTDNNRIRKVAPNGTIVTVAGNGMPSYSGDGGPATSAQLSLPGSVAVDGAGSLYIADTFNSRIRKVSGDGTITTVAGNGTYGNSGDGGSATGAMVGTPRGVAVNGAGALYIAAGCGIRRVSPDGTIGTFAGSWQCGFSGDGGPPSRAALNVPQGLTADSTGALYVADSGNNAVRVATPTGARAVFAVQATHGGIFAPGEQGATYTVTVANALFAGPSSGTVTLTAALSDGLTLVSMSGRGWSCAANACTRGDPLPDGASYPPITVAVNVAADAPAQVAARFSASGGGGLPGGASVLSPVVIPGSGPLIYSVVGSGSFLPGIVDGSWVSIWGANLATSTRLWRSDEIVDGVLPVSLDGVSVTFNGLPAAINYISPGQLNVQAPATGATGPVNVVVTNSLGQTTAAAVVARNEPGLFMFAAGGGKYPAAQVARPDGGLDYLGPPGLLGATVFTRPARPGETIVLWATGLGPTSPPVPVGRVFAGAAGLVDPYSATVGGLDAHVDFAGTTGAGLDQLNVVLPANLPTGEQPVVVTVNGAASQPGVVIAVGP
jgi:uncharacterized protein (TIGR03437 family)